MTTPNLTAPQAALDHARSVRERMRERSPDDAERRATLQAALGLLQDSWSDDHEAYVRRGPMIGRRNSDDPVRVLRRELTNEVKRLRSAVNRTSGTPREAAPTVTAASMSSHIARSVQVVRAIATEHETVRRVLGSGEFVASRSGGFYRSMHTLNSEAAALLDKLRAERHRINLAWQRYERRVGGSYAEQDAFDRLADRMLLHRDEMATLAAELVASTKQKKPHAAAQRRTPWTFETINHAINGYRARHGRRPTKVEFNSDPTLPHYTQLRRVLGPNPLRTLDL
jgi:hypothetical protein